MVDLEINPKESHHDGEKKEPSRLIPPGEAVKPKETVLSLSEIEKQVEETLTTLVMKNNRKPRQTERRKESKLFTSQKY